MIASYCNLAMQIHDYYYFTYRGTHVDDAGKGKGKVRCTADRHLLHPASSIKLHHTSPCIYFLAIYCS
jgi:uncharacterized ParB-like nuclease family protein